MKKIKQILLLIMLTILPLNCIEYCDNCNHYHIGQKCLDKDCDCDVLIKIKPQGVDNWPFK